jgi:hypothetical protein
MFGMLWTEYPDFVGQQSFKLSNRSRNITCFRPIRGKVVSGS